jgi:pSer/pThr/pTyr-binding forkhead associated (FHA) protein
MVAAVPESPLAAHAATPAELKARIAAQRRGLPFLLYRDGDGALRVYALERTERITVGRRPGNDVRLDWDAKVSRVHAALEHVAGEWTVIDDGLSHNGTFLGGRRLGGRHRLQDGETIQVGGTVIAYCEPGADGEASTETSIGPRIAELLSPAQRRVLLALCRPFRDAQLAAPAANRTIAEELVISVDSVKGTMHDLFELFGIQDLPQNQKRAQLALDSLQTGVISRREL